MILYADRPGRRLIQVLSDVGVLAWTGVCATLGSRVHDATLGLAAPGRQLASTGGGFRERMASAAAQVDHLPLLEDRLAAPVRSAASTGADLERTGQDLVVAVERLATVLGWSTALVPIVLVAALWATLRGRFVRQASAARAFIDADADLDLFALRAMARQPMHRLARISADPAGAWRRGDEAVVRALAALELKDAGLRPPPVTTAWVAPGAPGTG
jgi:hypothetical protein